MKRFLLLGLFVVLMADSMFGWGLGIGPGLSVKNAALYVLILLLAMEFAVTRERHIFELPAIHLLFGLLIALAAFSWALNTFVGGYTGYRPLGAFIALKSNLVDHYLFFLIFFLGARRWADVLWLQRWILVVIALGSIATVMDAYNLPDLNVIEMRRDGRVQGPLGEANQYGLFVALFLPILFARAWVTRGIERAFFAGAALFTFWVLVLTVSRGSYASLLVGSVLAAVYLREFLDLRYVAAMFGLACVGVLAAVLLLSQEYVNLIVDRVIQASSMDDAGQASSGRTWIWGDALDRMTTEPLSFLIGYGWNTFRSAVGIAPHNTYLGYLFELGVFGALLFVFLFGAIVRHAKAALRVSGTHPEVRGGLIGFVIGLFVLLVGIFFLDLTTPWYFIWAYCGLVMRGVAEVVRAPESVDTTVAASVTQTVPSHPKGSAAYPQHEHGVSKWGPSA